MIVPKLCIYGIVACIVVFIIHWLLLIENKSRPRYSGLLETETGGDRCPKKMVFQFKSYGRLGNQMLDYANIYVVAQELSESGHVGVMDDNRKDLDKYFASLQLLDIIQECKAHKQLEAALDGKTGAKLKELYYGSASATDVANFAVNHDNIVFDQYDWVPLLFPKYLEDFRRAFQFRDTIMSEARSTFAHMSRLYDGYRKPLLFVGVHVRRRDYALYLYKNFNMELLGSEFFLAGMDYFKHKFSKEYKVIFMAVSDDPQWVVDHLVSDDLHEVSRSPAVDMALLSACNHTITDYGTFGFWPSLLHGGEHYTSNVAPDYFVAMMNQMKNWIVVNITKPRVSRNHPAGWISPTFGPV